MNFSQAIKPHVSNEINLANQYFAKGEHTLAFHHLERAHVLAQQSPSQHLRTHVHMFGWALRTLSFKEGFGQVIRMLGSMTQNITGYFPPGNTGGSDISPFEELPIPDDLLKVINSAKADIPK
jgi:hypothetical protein